MDEKKVIATTVITSGPDQEEWYLRPGTRLDILSVEDDCWIVQHPTLDISFPVMFDEGMSYDPDDVDVYYSRRYTATSPMRIEIGGARVWYDVEFEWSVDGDEKDPISLLEDNALDDEGGMAVTVARSIIASLETVDILCAIEHHL